jgi:hypothetical protein
MAAALTNRNQQTSLRGFLFQSDLYVANQSLGDQEFL